MNEAISLLGRFWTLKLRSSSLRNRYLVSGSIAKSILCYCHTLWAWFEQLLVFKVLFSTLDSRVHGSEELERALSMRTLKFLSLNFRQVRPSENLLTTKAIQNFEECR
jgi:hypothetical protein